MTFLLWILLFGLYLIIGRVIVMALNKRGHIDDETLEFLMFVTYLLLPITLFVVGVQIASDYLITFFKIK